MGTWVRRSRVVVALVAAFGLLVGACSDASPLQTFAPKAATTASNHQLAVAETARLLASVELPAGSERASSAGSRLLDQPGNGTLPGATDGRHYWRVREAYGVAAPWIDAHAPSGSKPGGSTTTQGSKVVSTVGGFTYFPPSTAAWQTAQLSVEMTAIGPDVTAVRADAQVQWLDPTPYPDQTKGPRLHVDASGPCPASVAAYSDVSNSGSGLRAALVPAGFISSVLVCRYGEPAPPPHPDLRLTLSSQLDRRAVHYLVAKTRKIVVAHPTVEPEGGCEGTALSMVVVVVYGYADGRSVDLWLEPTQCGGGERNGSIDLPEDGTVWAALQLTTPRIATDA